MSVLKNDEIRKAVRENYSKVAVSKAVGCGCSTSSCCEKPNNVAERTMGYSVDDVTSVPEGANMGLGCGNPQAIASLKSGETVLDLGSGGGFDCFLAARQVGDSGHVIGVDMTPEMISKARENADKGEYQNVEFRLGEIENLPVADESVDVIISNCVINLSPDKPRVFSEAFRTLKKGGRLAITDVVAFIELPPKVKQDMALYSSCIAGAAHITEVAKMLTEAGFQDIRIEPKNESKSFIRE
jgi:SAM-dependent methyltransferase